MSLKTPFWGAKAIYAIVHDSITHYQCLYKKSTILAVAIVLGFVTPSCIWLQDGPKQTLNEKKKPNKELVEGTKLFVSVICVDFINSIFAKYELSV